MQYIKEMQQIVYITYAIYNIRIWLVWEKYISLIIV